MGKEDRKELMVIKEKKDAKVKEEKLGKEAIMD